jgi:hypothetical protein
VAHRGAGGGARPAPAPWYDLGKALDFHGDAAGRWPLRQGRSARRLPRTGAALCGARWPSLEGGDARVARSARPTACLGREPWLVLEIAWRELPPPRTDDVFVARNDYGAVRGMFHPRGIDAEEERSSQWARYEEAASPLPVLTAGPAATRGCGSCP